MRVPGWLELRARSDLLALLLLALFALALAAVLAAFLLSRDAEPARPGWQPPRSIAPARPSSPTPSEARIQAALVAGFRFQSVAPDRARRLNAAISSDPQVRPAPPFAVADADPLTRDRATDCLAAGIAFADGASGPAARRALAQLVLNRVRHFAYPKSVCGVVFARTAAGACQLGTACDPARRRAPTSAVWASARAIAAAALAGAVDRGVGLSTHLHRDTQLPVPNPAFTKTTTVGQLIFYRGAGSWSAPGSFSAYQGLEPDEPAMAGLWSDEVAAATLPAALPEPSPDPALPEGAGRDEPDRASAQAPVAVRLAPPPVPIAAPAAPRDTSPLARPASPSATPLPEPEREAPRRPVERRLPLPRG
jgi:spore germination cell wall hydrolase CwlJ-like protein